MSLIVDMEFIPPNANHIITEASAYSFNGTTYPARSWESVKIDGQARERAKTGSEPWGPWTCAKASPPKDKGATSKQVTTEVSRGPDGEIEGTSVRTYFFTDTITTTLPDNSPFTATVKTTIYVGVQTGLPRRMIYFAVRDGTDQKPTTIDFYDYEAKIELKLPPCEKEK